MDADLDHGSFHNLIVRKFRKLKKFGSFRVQVYILDSAKWQDMIEVDIYLLGEAARYMN